MRVLGSGFGRRFLEVLTVSSMMVVVTSGVARAECIGLARGPIVFDVNSCAVVQPETAFPATDPQYSWLHQLDPNSKRKFMDTYRGLALKGLVVKSSAVSRGISDEHGVLLGERITIFVPPGTAQCAGYQAKRVEAEIVEDCCLKGEPPCLVTKYVWNNPKVVGSADLTGGMREEGVRKGTRSKEYTEGFEALKSRQFKVAAAKLEVARKAGQLDLAGHYFLGFSYRMIDQCRKAIEPLEWVNKKVLANDVWSGDRKLARRAVMLLARCYAKNKDTGPAVLILNQYLVEPKKFSEEIATGLDHADFGWIRTTREYIEWRDAAQRVR